MKPIKFNDTSDYSYVEVLGVEGVFTPLRIDRQSLPEGFYKYSFRSGENELIEQIGHDVFADHAGDFLTKTPVSLGEDGNKSLTPDEWRFVHKDFNFEEHFGCKLSIDCQISLADAKRARQMGEGREEKANGPLSPQKNNGPHI